LLPIINISDKKSIGFFSPGYRPPHGLGCLYIRPAKDTKSFTAFGIFSLLFMPSCYHEIKISKSKFMGIIKSVSRSGQISLGKKFAGKTVLIDQIQTGVWVVKLGQLGKDREKIGTLPPF
jgi:hypothetical protein